MSLFEELSKERKQLQAEGKLPKWFTTMSWQAFKGKYLYQADTYEEQIDRIVENVGRYLKDRPKYFKSRWKEMLMENHAYLATPVLANNGTSRGLSVSCSGSVIPDSIYGFGSTRLESSILSQEGFGTSSYLGGIRHRGASISRGGTADGVLPVFKDMVIMAENVSQGGVRRGAWAGYLPLDHEDFWEIALEVKNNPDGSNVGWNISDDVIRQLKIGDKEITARYQEALYLKMVTGKGYFHFPDKIARHQPECYRRLGLSNKSSGLCVAPETLILTDKGYRPIVDLKDQEVVVWTGKDFSKASVRRTGVNQKLITVNVSGERKIECTPYHKFFRVELDKHGGYVRTVTTEAKDLVEGDKLVKTEFPCIEGKKILDKAYTNGFFTGDGCSYKDKSIIYLYADKVALKPFIEHEGRWAKITPNDRGVGGLRASNVTGLADKFLVPDSSYTINSRLAWLSGLIDADGCAIGSIQNGHGIQLGSTNLPFLQEVRYMLHTLGVESVISTGTAAGLHQLPCNDGTGGYKNFLCKTSWRVTISATETAHLLDLGLKTNRLNLSRKLNRGGLHYPVVTSVIDEGRIDDTYCFNEPVSHRGIFNGILTQNCNEILLHADENASYTCVLSGMVLTTFDEWKNTDAVFCMSVFLDCLVEDFLQTASNIKGLERVINGTSKSRAVGLGATGYHSAIQQRMLPWDSLEAHLFNMEVFNHIHDESLKASRYMAKVYGEPEWCAGTGLRNTHRTALAPNVSSALIFGSESQGITPWYGNVYTEGTASGEMFRVNPMLVKLLKKHGKYTHAVLREVLADNGSVRNLGFLTALEKQVLLTAFEINQKSVIDAASRRQPKICQGQSINLFFDADEDESYISYIHQYAFEDENTLGLYYIRSKAGVDASKGGCASCAS